MMTRDLNGDVRGPAVGGLGSGADVGDRGTDVGGRGPGVFVFSLFAVAASIGTVHGVVSLYWASGGEWLTETVSAGIRASFEGQLWLLAIVGLVKIVAAWSPLLLASSVWSRRRLWRAFSWAGALVLVIWGGLTTVVGNLVLSGIVISESGFERSVMIGQAWIWDPMFFLWGLSLGLGLYLSRPAGGYFRL